MCRAPLCLTLAGGDRSPPSPVSQGLLPPYRDGSAPRSRRGRAVPGVCHRGHGCLASAPLCPLGYKGRSQPPEGPKPQLERRQVSSDREFPTCSAPGAALTEGTASPATKMAREEVTGTGWKPPRAGRCLGAPRCKAALAGPGRACGTEGVWGWRMPAHGGPGGGHEFLLRGLLHPQAPGKSCFSESTWKQPHFPAKAGGEELQRKVYILII